MKRSIFSFFLLLAGLAVMLPSCSEYSKVLKEKDINMKYAAAVKYYENSECFKALPLFEELLGLTRGTQLAEDVYYYYAKSEYCVKDYYLANYYFKSFTKTFGNTERAEECQFLAALCSYRLSPAHSLDQTDTKAALSEFQLFLDKYPGSSLRDSANHMVERLRFKLEDKAFDICKLYVKTERFKAAVQSLGQFAKDYPDSKFLEEAHYLMVQSGYEYAQGSIETRKLERYRSTIESYITFASLFPQSRWLKDAESYYEKSRKQIERLTASKDQTQ